jgi:hypothetical protein
MEESCCQPLHVVLVHGAWADGSSWSKVIGPLKAAGMKVFAAPLPMRTRPVDHTPMVTAPADIADIILDAARDVAATS